MHLLERLKQKKQVPSQNDNVVHVKPENDNQRSPTDSLETGHNVPSLENKFKEKKLFYYILPRFRLVP